MRASGAITLIPAVTPVSTETYNGSINLLYNGSVMAAASGGTAPYTYTLTDPAGNSYPQNIAYYPGLGPGTYTLSVTDADGQTAGAPAVVSYLYPQPSVTASFIVQPSACDAPDGGFTLTGSGGTPPYAFSIDGGYDFFASISHINLPAGAYHVLVKDNNGQIAMIGINPTSTQPGQVILNAPFCMLEPAINPSLTSCTNQGSMSWSVFSYNPPVSFSFDGINFRQLDLNTTVPDVYQYDTTGLAPGLYHVSTEDNIGNAALMAITIVKYCILRLDFSRTPATCGHSDGSVTVTASSGTPPYNYTIDGVNYSPGGVFTGLATGFYTIMAVDMNGVTNYNSVHINGACPVSVSGTVVNTDCSDRSGKITATGSGGSPPYTFSIDGTHFQSGILFGALSAGTYNLTVRDGSSPLQTAGTSVTVAIDTNLSVDAGPDLTICDNSSTTLDALSNGNVYSWSPATGLSNTASLDPNAAPRVTTKYYLTTTLGSCRAEDSMTVNVNPAPVANAGTDTTICPGQSAQLQGSGNNGGAPDSYQWSPSTYLDNPAIADPVVIRPAATITYQLTVTAANGCPSAQAPVTVHVTSPPTVFAGNDTSVLAGEPLLLHAIDVNNSGFTQWAWTPSTDLNNPAIADPIALPQRATTYTVVATTPAGCQGSAEIAVKVFTSVGLFVPNAFTPNGDGHNDVLKAIPVGMRSLSFFSVFSRPGQRVFFTTDASAGWDGRFNGRPQNSGVYVWMAEGIDLSGRRIDREGTVLLIR
jgi:gliding motility-associated-like protein